MTAVIAGMQECIAQARTVPASAECIAVARRIGVVASSIIGVIATSFGCCSARLDAGIAAHDGKGPFDGTSKHHIESVGRLCCILWARGRC
jgi:predicted ThiF/HesA family dinucleotide-utilizing enzyme